MTFGNAGTSVVVAVTFEVITVEMEPCIVDYHPAEFDFVAVVL